MVIFMAFYRSSSIFFFQAEDGIRDGTVTGIQTCALPIYLLLFIGKCHVAYMPRRKIVGLSKIPRLVEMYSRRLQVQERLTKQIANTLNDVLQPMGVAVVMEGIHLCMLMRGVEKQNSKAVTSAMLGAFRDRPETRAEFMELIKSGRGLQI